MTEQPVFGPADFVSIKGLEGVYSAEKETKSPETQLTVRITALADGRYRCVTKAISPRKKNKVETFETGFIPLGDIFHLGIFTIPDSKVRLNFYMLTDFRAGDIQIWYYSPSPGNRDDIDLKPILAGHGLSIRKNGPMGMTSLISSGQNGVPSPETLKAFFMEVVGGKVPAADLEKSGWQPMLKLVKKK